MSRAARQCAACPLALCPARVFSLLPKNGRLKGGTLPTTKRKHPRCAPGVFRHLTTMENPNPPIQSRDGSAVNDPLTLDLSTGLRAFFPREITTEDSPPA